MVAPEDQRSGRDATATRVRGRRAGRPSTSEASALERDVLAAALAEFRSHGFAGASIERIAAAAAITRSAIYRRYGDKSSLFDTVIQAEIDKLRALADQVVQTSDDPLRRLHDAAKAYCRFALSPIALDLQRIVVWEAARDAESSRIEAVPSELSEPLDALIMAAQAAGRLRAGPAGPWRDALIRLVADGPRWEALASGAVWSDDRLTADFERMWTIFLSFAGADSGA